MHSYTRRFSAVGVALALAGTMLAIGPAQADPKPSNVFNGLDATIDDTHEVLNLALLSPATDVGIKATRPGNQQSQGCGLGGPHRLVLDVASSNAGVATVNTPVTIEACNDTVPVTVTPVGLGMTEITFTFNGGTTVPQPHDNFTLGTAAFDVNVTDVVVPPGPTDYWRHAPAIANQYLKGGWLACVSWNTSSGKKPSNAHGNLISYLTHSVDAWLLAWAESMSEFYEGTTFIYDRSNDDHVQAVLVEAYGIDGYPDWEEDVEAFVDDICGSGPTGGGQQFTSSSGAPPQPVFEA